MKKYISLFLCACMIVSIAGCGSAADKRDTDSTSVTTSAVTETCEETAVSSSSADETSAPDETASQSIDYLALVNKLNPLPDGWEDALETVKITNSVNDEVEIEKKAYNAYLLLKADLEENDGIYIELDSARRSVADQQRIMDEFTKKYGADYAAKTVAMPGFSEHHTGLALDLYFRLKSDDGCFTDVYYNEDMMQYPEIWEKIHSKLAAYGFILRYLEDKEYITGYGYEPWHIRYVDSADIAKEIMSKPGMTLEVYLGAVKDTNPAVDLGSSALFTEEELKEAAVQIKCKFASFEGCELYSLRYAGDERCTEGMVKWANETDTGNSFTHVIEFLSDHDSPEKEYTNYEWWLARSEDGGWQLLQWGESRTADDIIEEIITYHGCYGDKADAKVDELLAELTNLDVRQGALWTDIMKYWDYANTELTVNIDRLPDDLPTGDNLALAVLGFELNDDGTMQDELIGRLTVALNCAEQYPNAYVICTGGGTAKNNPDVTEGGLMGEWMLEHGLDPNRLIIEDKSLTTAENASNSYDIILNDYPQIDSIVVISSDYHIAWGSLLFEAAFMKSASEKQTPPIHVISNCSCKIENDIYLWSEILRWETGGMLQMVGNNDLAMQYYFDYDNVEKPEL